MATRITEPLEGRISDASRRQMPNTLQRNLVIPHTALAEFCQRNQIRKLSLFGSVLRDDFGPESDVDILVEFERGVPIHYIKFVQLQDELGHLFGREIDLHTPNSLSRHFRTNVLQVAWVLYERAG